MFPLHWVSETWLLHLVMSYGAWAVFVCVALESTGLPVPSESILIAVAVTTAAGDPHTPAILTIVLAAAAGAVLGDNLGYLIGRNAGAALVQRYGPRLGLTPRRQRLGRFLFHRYGAQVVFVARFVSLLRTCVSVLAGMTQMRWPRFLVYNALGGCTWAILVGYGAYILGGRIHAWSASLSLGLAVVVGLTLVGFILFLRRQEGLLQAKADIFFAAEAQAWE